MSPFIKTTVMGLLCTGLFLGLTPALGRAYLSGVLGMPFTNVVDAAVINVPADQPTIQAAINAAVSGVDEVVVAPGTYNEIINFIGKAITVHRQRCFLPLWPRSTCGPSSKTSPICFVRRPESLSRRRQRPDWPAGGPGERIGRRGSRRRRWFSLESSA